MFFNRWIYIGERANRARNRAGRDVERREVLAVLARRRAEDTTDVEGLAVGGGGDAVGHHAVSALDLAVAVLCGPREGVSRRLGRDCLREVGRARDRPHLRRVEILGQEIQTVRL